ncbi:DUF756 domain-containing protein [Streptomyces sp. RS10V-4]|nr:DUF756 domain-containing protein [Streptomyces rhizoryzae]
MLRFLELVTRVREPNISQWRRAVCGDLTSCFGFGGAAHTQLVGPREQVTVTWPTKDGRYDVTVTADGHPEFAQRYAGTVHAMPEGRAETAH